MIAYTLLTAFIFAGLLVSESLLYSFSHLLTQSEELVASSDSVKEAFTQQMSPISSLYTNIRTMLFASYLLLSILFVGFYHHKKVPEFIAWKQNGATTVQWFFIQLIELVLPIFFVTFTLLLLLFLFQPIIQQELMMSHLTLFNHEKALHDVIDTIGDSQTQQLIITMPKTNQAFIQNVDMSSSDWFTIILTSLQKTTLFFLSVITLLTAVSVSISAIFWRKKQWIL